MPVVGYDLTDKSSMIFSHSVVNVEVFVKDASPSSILLINDNYSSYVILEIYS